ncbi:MAG TPA: hypothetical protein VLE48_05765 [Terriglobales bacterium]|nr:hypothetical protein [Terriglobales bacterium]
MPALASWASAGSLGSNQAKSAGTSNLTITTTAAAEANNVIVCALAADNLDTADAETTHWSVSDSASNTYTRATEFENAQGSAGGGANASIFFSKVATQLNSGGTITFTSDSSVTAKAASCWEFTITSTNVVSVAGKSTLPTDGADPAAISLGSLSAQEYLWVHALAGEGPDTDAYTWDADYTQLTANGTTGASAASNMHVRSGIRIFTGTTDSVDVTSDTSDRDYAQVLVALKEAPPPAGPATVPRVIRW